MNVEDKDITRVRISQALEKGENCFLCHLEGRLERRFIETYLSELVMDAKAREKIVESRGFCNYHFYKMFVSASNPASEDGLGMALILKSVTEQLLEDVKDQQNISFAVTKPWNLKRFVRSIPDIRLTKPVSNEVKCPACDHVSKMVKIYIEEFLREILQDEEMRNLYDKSKGMCMPHHVMTLRVATNLFNGRFALVIKRLIEKEIQTLERLQENLAEYVEKQDYRFSNEEKARTEEFVGRSLSQLVGKRGVEKTLAKLLRTGEASFP